MERIDDVGAQEAYLVEAVCPEEVDRVGDRVGDPREDDAIALADQAVDEGARQVPHEAVLHA
eukprot:97307-Alexandrium_andersonii.AAC.1